MTLGADGTSTRPYLLRALHDWCTDNGFTPYLAVHVGPGVQVPMEYVKNNEIVLNCGFEATSGLKLGNEFVEFKARFGGVARDIQVPVDHVVAIYARENGQGMAFPMPALTPNDHAGPGTGPNRGPTSGLAAAGSAQMSGLRLAAGGDELAAAGVGTVPTAPSTGPYAAPALVPVVTPASSAPSVRALTAAPGPTLVEGAGAEPTPAEPGGGESTPAGEPPPPAPKPTLKRIK